MECAKPSAHVTCLSTLLLSVSKGSTNSWLGLKVFLLGPRAEGKLEQERSMVYAKHLTGTTMDLSRGSF